MRLVAGAALAAALLLTGCGTQVDPFQDDAADALEVAWQACEIWTDYPEQGLEYEDYLAERSYDAFYAGRVASEAAYLDPRWRTLADAFPYVQIRYSRLRTDERLSRESDSRLREETLDQGSLWQPYVSAVDNECEAVYVLHGDEESWYDFWVVNEEGDPDTE